MSELRPLAGRARWATIALAAVIVVDLVAIWADLREIDLMDRLLDEVGALTVSDEELESNDDRQFAVGLAEIAVLAAAAFFFIRWFHGAYSNLRPLGQTELRYGPGWAIGSWFIPFLNLWWPKQIANDIARGSDPDAPRFVTDAAWKERVVPPLLGFWWGAWIVTSLLGNAVGRAWLSTETPEDLRSAAQLDAVVSVIDIVAAVLAILVLRQLTLRQEQRVQRVAASTAAADTMPTA